MAKSTKTPPGPKKKISGKTKKSTGKPKPTHKKKSPKKQKRSILGFLFKWSFVLGLWGIIGLSCLLAWYAAELPGITKSARFERQSAITILDRHGQTLMRYGEMKGNIVSADELPTSLIQAVIAVEDRRFYDHFGIDIIGITRAMMTNIAKGRLAQGGSTITQQLAKNLFLSHKRTIKRKIQEAMLAIWLENQLSKDEILSAYLNRVYLGSGAYGVDAASQLYFDIPVQNINLYQSALLAGLLKAPSRYSPLSNPELSKKRTTTVLSAMQDAGYISKSDAKNANNIQMNNNNRPSNGSSSRYFTDWVIDGLDELVSAPKKDLIVETTLDLSIQNHSAASIQSMLDTYGEERNIGQGAALIMGLDGAVLAMIGGRNYKKSQFNRITQAKRPPGSSFKPVVYLTALEKGWRPGDQILDAPIEEGSYRPKNYKEKYYGLVSLETALSKSLNTPAVRLMDEIGRGHVLKTARRLGIISPLPSDLSVALGSTAISPLEISAVYSSFANGGHAVFPYGITKISDTDGKVYYERPQTTISRKIIERRPLRGLNDMLRNVVKQGTGRASALSIPSYGKTGTSQNFRDAWFIAYTDNLVGTIWLGNDDNSPMIDVTGGGLPARIWADMIGFAENTAPTKAVIHAQDNSGFQGLLGRLLSSSQDQDHRAQRRYND